MRMLGYVLLHRKIFDNFLYFAEVFSKIMAWIDLILIANHSSRKIDIRGNLITVNRGQIARSEENLAKRWKWSRGKVRRFLKLLVDEGMIVQHKTPAITLISIVSYDTYQSNRTTNKTSVDTTDGTETSNDKVIEQLIHNVSDAKEDEKYSSSNYQLIVTCWREERIHVGLSTELIGENSKIGAQKLASAIDKGETTLGNVRKAIQNLLTDTEKREKYSLNGLANNFELWLNRSHTQKIKTIQLNQTKDIVYYFGVCRQCGYSMTGF